VFVGLKSAKLFNGRKGGGAELLNGKEGGTISQKEKAHNYIHKKKPKSSTSEPRGGNHNKACISWPRKGPADPSCLRTKISAVRGDEVAIFFAILLALPGERGRIFG